MERIAVKQLQAALICAARQIVEAEPLLTELDTLIGDGDHGTGMKSGFSALGQQLQAMEYTTLRELFHAAGLCLVRSMGGASGVLFGTLWIGGLEMLPDGASLSPCELVAFFGKSIEAIQRRGRASPGEKTMVDALLPAQGAMELAIEQSNSMAEVLQAGYRGALAGVEQTKAMLPRAGRAKNFREKALGHPDPGAVSVSIIFGGLAEGIVNQR